jgi:carbon storage regulator CsrA
LPDKGGEATAERAPAVAATATADFSSGNGITLTVIEVLGNRVRVGIEAPAQVRILRAELAGSQDERAEPLAPSGE